MVVDFLETILSDLDLLDIPYEEHYDPDGMQLFQLLIREIDNPLLIYSSKNPENALITISRTHPCPNLQNLDRRDIFKLQAKLMKIGSKLVLKFELKIIKNNLFFIAGIALNSTGYRSDVIGRGILKLTKTYDSVVSEAIEIIQKF